MNNQDCSSLPTNLITHTGTSKHYKQRSFIKTKQSEQNRTTDTWQ